MSKNREIKNIEIELDDQSTEDENNDEQLNKLYNEQYLNNKSKYYQSENNDVEDINRASDTRIKPKNTLLVKKSEKKRLEKKKEIQDSAEEYSDETAENSNSDHSNYSNETEYREYDEDPNIISKHDTYKEKNIDRSKKISQPAKIANRIKMITQNHYQIKRGPGRPCKAPKKEPMEKKGIMRTPMDSNNHIEFIYDKPITLKRIFNIFKQLAVSQVQITFRLNEIIFYAQDHHGKTDIRIKINASKVNHYYCRSEFECGVQSSEVESILNVVDKEYSSLVITSNILNIQKNLTMSVENALQADEIYTIELIGNYKHMENEHEFLQENYTISFEYPGDQFKKTISSIRAISAQLSIVQDDKYSPLTYKYNNTSKKIHVKHNFKFPEKIKFKSNVKEDTCFRVDIKLDYLKPISSAQISEYITIFVDENKKLMTRSYLDDETIEIKTLTEIIDNRPQYD